MYIIIIIINITTIAQKNMIHCSVYRREEYEYCCQVCNINDEDTNCYECKRFLCYSPECSVAIHGNNQKQQLLCSICYGDISEKLQIFYHENE